VRDQVTNEGMAQGETAVACVKDARALPPEAAQAWVLGVALPDATAPLCYGMSVTRKNVGGTGAHTDECEAP
jgi:hypothetical protein